MDQETTQEERREHDAMEPTQNPLTRRQMLRGVAGTGLVLLLPVLTDAATPGPWTAIGKAALFPLNQPQRVAVAGGGVLYVTRTGNTQLTAVSAKCTHRGCELGWAAADSQLQCPCHGAAFASNGKNIHGTRRSPDEQLPALTNVPARQKAGQVEVNLQTVPAGTLVPGRDA